MVKEAKFILDKPTAKEPTHIFLKFTCSDSPLKYSTKEKIHPDEWDFELQRAKKNRKINSELDRLHSIVDAYTESQRKLGIRNTSKVELKEELDRLSGKKKIKVNLNATSQMKLSDAFENLIKEAAEGKLLTPKQRKRYSRSTLKTWGNAKERFIKYNPDLTLDEITLETYNDFITNCNSNNFTTNYTGTFLKIWKRIMDESFKKKWHRNIIHRDPEFIKISEKVELVYLDMDEISALYSLDLTGNKFQETLRDRYIINLFNGLRISDMKTIDVENIHSDAIIHINAKTKKKVAIPVHEVVNKIIKKYGGKMPKQYSEQTVNDEIKKICKAAGLKSKVHFKRTEGGVTKTYIKEKWEMVTNHTARRSMVTNMLKHVKLHEAQPVTGMSLSTLQLYNKISAEDNAKHIKDNDFFKIR